MVGMQGDEWVPFPTSVITSQTEATFCFRMRMQMQARLGLLLPYMEVVKANWDGGTNDT